MDTISESEILRALEDAFKRPNQEGVLTGREIQEETGRSDKWVQKHIRLAIAAGKMEYVGRVQRMSVCGSPTSVPGYQMIQ